MKAKINNNRVIKCCVGQGKSINSTVNDGAVFSAAVNEKENICAGTTQRGAQGIPGEAATIQLGSVSTGAAGSDVIITNSGDEHAAIFNFTIPRGDRGDKGETGSTGATGNGIVNIEKAFTAGLVDTYHVNYTNGNYDSFNVTNGKDGEGSVTDVTVNGVSVLDGSVAKVLVPTNISSFTNDSGYITSSALTGYATETYVDTGLATKQATLVSGTNIKTINNISLLGSGNITITSAPDIDNKSITTNSDDELQTVGVIDQNNTTNAIKTWTGTKAQYDAIVTKDANTLYNITDDSDVTFALLELLFPVGAVYFGTMSVCPLQTLGIGTWQALPQDKVIQIAGTRGSVGDTLNAGLPNITGSFGSGWEAIVNTDVGNISANGLFAGSTGQSYGWHGFTQHEGRMMSVKADASLSNPIYGNSSTVQPDAYLLNGWRRIA